MSDGRPEAWEAPTADLPLSFDAWLPQRAASLERFAYLLTGNRDDAHEALQTALTNACAKWARVRARSRCTSPEG